MATKVHMEALSPTMEEGQVVRWLKAEGDEVSNGDVIAEIETDKATMELVARGEGLLRKILVGEGSTAPVGTVIAVIAGADEDIASLVADAAGGEAPESPREPEDGPTGEEKPVEAGAEEPTDNGEEEPTGNGEEEPTEKREEKPTENGGEAEATRPAKPKSDQEMSQEDGGRVRASPLARRLAAEAGLDLTTVEGSGPGGRIVKRDIEEARAGASAGARAPAARGAPAAPPSTQAPPPAGAERPAAPAPEPWSDAGAEEGYDDLPVSQMRKTIARRLIESIGPVPHFFLTIDVDMARVLEARVRLNALIEKDGDKLSVNDFVLKATAAALRRHPECNVAWHTDHIRRYRHVHLGVAVAVEDGLITPVVRHADRKGLVQISREVKEMAGRARQKRLKPEEYTGATFSVSNLGMFGIHEFTAIINPPESGILAVGGVEDTPVAVDGAVVVRPRMRVTMSCDHRVVDGAMGARFLQTLQALLEEPAAALL